MEEPKLQRLNAEKSAYVYSMSTNPEEEAMNQIIAYAKAKGLTDGDKRLFGRNIYPTDKPEPHGYEYYLEVNGNTAVDPKIAVGEIPSGLYAVLQSKGLHNIAKGWQTLFSWVEKNGYAPVGVVKGAHGWVSSAFEELINWQQPKPPAEWVFNLWVLLRE